MASLYLARYSGPDGFEKHVAIKRIHEHLAENPEFCRMFVDEARLAARITHPNVAQVLELGAVSGSYFIAMEYVDGESLTALLRRTRVPLGIAARIVSQVAQGLHSAHELRGADGHLLNVVHRDVSPSNLLITYDGVPKIVDFGVAKAKGNTATTGAGTIKGKFAYIAPEQLSVATASSIDRRADIFALGIILYEVTTWRRLFHADSDAATTDMVLNTKINPPSSVMSDYPPELERIVMRALQRNREDRYQTAHEMHLDLEAFIATLEQPVLPSTVGEFMRQIFPDLIAEKQEMMAKCREMLAEEEEDDPAATTPASAAGEMMRELKPPRSRSLTIGLSAAGLLVVCGAGAAIYAGSRSGTREEPRYASLAQPAKQRVRLQIRTTPAAAAIFFDGKKVSSPFELTLQREPRRAPVVISAPGFVERRFEVPLSEDGSWLVALAPVAPDARTPTQLSSTEPPAAKDRPGRAKKGKKLAPRVKDLFKNPYDQ